MARGLAAQGPLRLGQPLGAFLEPADDGGDGTRLGSQLGKLRSLGATATMGTAQGASSAGAAAAVL